MPLSKAMLIKRAIFHLEEETAPHRKKDYDFFYIPQ